MDDLIPRDSSSDSTDEARAAHSPQAGSDKTRRRKAGQIYDADDCLRGLTQLPGLIALGMIRANDANAMRAAYGVILQHHQRAQTAGVASAISDADVMKVLRTNPEMLNLLAPLLTDAQLELALKQSADEEPNAEQTDEQV